MPSFSGELAAVGRVFDDEKQRDLTIKIGRRKLKWMGQLSVVGIDIRNPEDLEFPLALWEEAQTSGELAQLARFSLMGIDNYLHRHEYRECISAAENLFDRVGANPSAKEYKSDVESAHFAVLCSRAALICQALASDDESGARYQAEELLTATARARSEQRDTLDFLRTYSAYLLGDMDVATAAAVECAHLANRQRRCELLSMIELEDTTNDW
jgi:hypothetical protein